MDNMLYPTTMRIFDNSSTPVEPKCLILRYQLNIIVLKMDTNVLEWGREDEYFWKTAKERENLEEKESK